MEKEGLVWAVCVCYGDRSLFRWCREKESPRGEGEGEGEKERGRKQD